ADTDAQGHFQFTGLPPGTYRLSATRTGFLERYARRPVAVGANSRVTDAEMRLPPQSVIAGRVLDEDGEPVERARVTAFKQVYRNGGRQWERINSNFETNDAGEYRISNLMPGRYLVLAHNTRPETNNRFGSPPQSFYAPAYYPNAVRRDQALPVAVDVG